MQHLTLASLALAAALGAAMPLAAQMTANAPDSAAEPLLAAEQLAHYIAVKKALNPYWQSHSALLQTAKASTHKPVVPLGMRQLHVPVFDYPSLVKQDTALAAIFTSNAFPATQFEPTQVAVFHALLTLALDQANGTALPPASSVLGKNVALVKAHQQELAAVGVGVKVNDGMGMNNGILQP